MEKHLLRERELHPFLLRQLRQNENELLFVLVDGTGNNSAVYELFRYAPDANYYPLFLGTEHEDCLPYSPYLANITTDHHEFIQRCSETSHEIVWFTSPYALEPQISIWQSRLYCDLPDGRNTLFRFWNGDILNRYLSLLSVEQRIDFLPAATHIFTPERSTHLWHHYALQDQISMATLDPDHWRIKQEHLYSFEENFNHIQHQDIEAELWDKAPDTLEKIHPGFITTVIESGVKSALQLGLTTHEGQYRYVECQLRWGDFFWKESMFCTIWNGLETDRDFLERLQKLESTKLTRESETGRP